MQAARQQGVALGPAQLEQQLLTEEFQKKHQERLRDYLDQLRAQARITG